MTEPSTLRTKFGTANLTLRLLSLALALVLWCISAAARPREARLTLPVRPERLPAGFRIAGTPPPAVRVTLSGPLHLVTGVARRTRVLPLDLEGATGPGTTSFTHLESALALPEEVRVTRISPASLEIRLEVNNRSEGEHHP